jgi:hypothetical protein
VPKDNASG